ncbi:electron transfer flavoprotein subunit beta [Breoghania sp.]|uniref:electron transfer flavoprotein subunit beta n=1 Tax=Breoghania sp. TaxID=2065378 RepID=UPI002AAB9440|nr:electron transfer flavoprotein subunit beta [Breoghania sp.]
MRIAVFLSLGRHPANGRARRAELDAKALELALGLAVDLTWGPSEIHAVHAGDPSADALRDYLGMGLHRLHVLDVAHGDDPVPALKAHLEAIRPDIVLTGLRAEAGEGSGMVPYLLAEALRASLVADVAGIVSLGDEVTVLQALPRGRRRQVTLRLPAVLPVNAAAPEPRAPAFARARRGIIEPHAVESVADGFLTMCETEPWRARPKRMGLPTGASAAQRMKAMTEARAGDGQVMVRPTPDEAAAALYDYLVAHRFLGPEEDSRSADTKK